ncbi:MAG: zinc-ribbon domain-containing protein [Phycisphaerae bacterium]
MLIIMGTTAKPVEQQRGRFHCPQCRSEAAYTLINIKNYFTLFFIPLLAVGSAGKIVRCDRCGSEFGPQVLKLPQSDPS